jgi:5'-3' exonuclease
MGFLCHLVHVRIEWGAIRALSSLQMYFEVSHRASLHGHAIQVFATGTEDMDALTFGSSVLLRHLSYSEARKMPIREVTLSKVLEGLGLSMPEFIDLCILMG